MGVVGPSRVIIRTARPLTTMGSVCGEDHSPARQHKNGRHIVQATKTIILSIPKYSHFSSGSQMGLSRLAHSTLVSNCLYMRFILFFNLFDLYISYS